MSAIRVEVNGVFVPLDTCGWLKRKPCGCIVAVATTDSSGDRTIATADQAHRHFTPRKDSRAREISKGYTFELITMDYYREHYRKTWECTDHTPEAATGES
jgi:hypothetical protein